MLDLIATDPTVLIAGTRWIHTRCAYTGHECDYEIPANLTDWDQLVDAVIREDLDPGGVYEVISDDQSRQVVRFNAKGWSC